MFRNLRELIAFMPQLMKSKTIIFNAATAALAVATALMNLEFIKENVEIMAFLSGTLVPLCNVLIRFFTTQSLSSKRGWFA